MTIKPSGVTSLSTTQSYNSISGVNSDLLSLDIYYRSNVSVSKPVVIYIHGGAWALGGKGNIDSKATFFNDLGYVFVSVNYRLSPAANLIKGYNLFVGDDGTTATASTRVKHSTHVSDCATAVTWVYNNISSYGGNHNQLILIGHSAGCHLASLLVTNQSYLTSAGLPSGKIIGCIANDSEGISGIYQQITNPVSDGDASGDNIKRWYMNAFGIYPDKTVTGTTNNITTDFATTTAAQTSYTTASPISYISASTPPFLVLCRGSSDRITRETQFVTALQSAGRTVTAVSYPDSTTYTHQEINESIGAVNDPPVGKSLPSGVSNVTTQIQNWITNLAPPPPNALGGDSSLSFSEISNEFGLPSGRNLGAYRVSQNVGTLTSLPLDTGVPQSGQIKFSDFYSKKLNVVVNYTGISTLGVDRSGTVQLNARSAYNSNAVPVEVVGGFRTKPSSSDNIKVFINYNTRIGSAKNGREYTAIRTGIWGTNTVVQVELGPSAEIYGAGGNGGTARAGGGSRGTSAIGIDYPVTVINRGYIQSGGGGGGAGGENSFTSRFGPWYSRRRRTSINAGSGGSGGAGYPAGTGGDGSGGSGDGCSGKDGNAGALTTGGPAQGACNSGGKGGDGNQNGAGGSRGGIGGTAGYAIIIYNDGTGTTISNVGGTITGTIQYNTAPS